MLAVGLGPLKPRVSCQYTTNPINYDLRTKSIPEFFSFLPFEILHGGVILKNEEVTEDLKRREILSASGNWDNSSLAIFEERR